MRLCRHDHVLLGSEWRRKHGWAFRYMMMRDCGEISRTDTASSFDAASKQEYWENQSRSSFSHAR